MRQSPAVAELTYFYRWRHVSSNHARTFNYTRDFSLHLGYTTRRTSTYAARVLPNCCFTYAATPTSNRCRDTSLVFLSPWRVDFVFFYVFFSFLSRLCRQLVVRFIRVLPSSNTNLSFPFFLPIPKKKLRTTGYTEVQR